MAVTVEEKKDKGKKIDRRKIRKIKEPARKGKIKKSLIEKAVRKVMAERSSD